MKSNSAQRTIGTKRFVRHLGTSSSHAQGTIEKFFRKKFSKRSIAQGTIEYLVILAVVVVIGLVVVSLLASTTDTQNLATTRGKIDTQTRSGIVITEAAVDITGDSFLLLRNNDPEEKTLTKITIDGKENIFDEKIMRGQEILIKLEQLETNCKCETGQTTKTCTYQIEFTSRYGITTTQNQTTTITCQENITPTKPPINPTPDYFRFMITTTTPNQSFTFLIIDPENLEVKWNENAINTYTAPWAFATHTFETAGDYNIDVKGSASRITFGGSGTTPTLLKDIYTPISAGVSGLTSANRMFENTNITSFTANDFFDEASKNIEDMQRMFDNSNFNQNISNWNTHNVENMRYMFRNTPFNQPIGNWNVSKVENMEAMFSNTPFNQPINSWNTENVQNFAGLFGSSDFNQPINDWNTENATDMSYMFFQTNFNQDISKWDTNNVTDMHSMFSHSDFNQNISKWNTGKVINMTSMFSSSQFNQPINDWNLENLEYITSMFFGSEFNQPINDWDFPKLTNMSMLFMGASFNQPINNWDTSNITNMSQMFRNATNFNQNLVNWDVDQVTNCTNFNTNTPDWSEPIPIFTNCSP